KVNIATVDANTLRQVMSDMGIGNDTILRVLATFSGIGGPNGGGGQPGLPGGGGGGGNPSLTNNSVLQFYIRSGLTAEQFALIENDLTVSTNAVIEGLVNVNTATATVLACLPGLDAAKADALIAARAGQATLQTSIAWVKDVLDEQSATQVGPFITGRSQSFSADIAAVGRHGRGYSRVKFIFDTIEGTPKIRLRQELTHLGWALGWAVREQIAEMQNAP
ncbi:MAG: hypothetical protein FJ392_04640, partial [Verrucomicrobia bacterium]|nr:hypothetical protein [Verrucomicrobiota bacterium]